MVGMSALQIPSSPQSHPTYIHWQSTIRNHVPSKNTHTSPSLSGASTYMTHSCEHSMTNRRPPKSTTKMPSPMSSRTTFSFDYDSGCTICGKFYGKIYGKSPRVITLTCTTANPHSMGCLPIVCPTKTA